MQLPATLHVHYPLRFLVWLGLAHLIAVIALMPTTVPLWAKSLIWFLLGISYYRTVRQPWPARLVLRPDGRLLWIDAEGLDAECRVHPSTVVLPWLIMLRLDAPDGRRNLPLTVDALGTEGHRRLRLWLREKAAGAAV